MEGILRLAITIVACSFLIPILHYLYTRIFAPQEAEEILRSFFGGGSFRA